MKIKHLTTFTLILGFILYSISSPASAFQKKNQEKKGKETKIIIIPQKVKSVFEEGLKTRQARLDIPFSVVWHIYLPARENMHSVFFFKVKNADLGFSPLTAPPESPEKKQEKKKEKVTPPEAETAPTTLQASGHIFLQFNRLENKTAQELIKEVYIPFTLQVESDSYDPDKEEIYSTGYPLPPGNYLLSMAIASLDLEKIGTQYFEFSLPNALSYTKELGTTPIFFVKDIKRVAAAETKAEVHKGFFTYSVLQIKPNIERIFSVGKNLDIFFFIFGAAPSQEGKYNIDVNYEVLKGEERVIRYATAHYDAPLISQPLPLKKTVLIKKGEEERKEQRDIEPGKYTLNINITDKVSGNSVKKTLDFEVKEAGGSIL